MQGLPIGKLAKAAKVSIDTIRFYEKCGLSPQPMRRPSGFREFSELDLLQLQLVRRARAVGFSLEQIAELITLREEASVTAINDVIEHQRSIVDRKLAQLEEWRRALSSLAHETQQPLFRQHFLRHFFVEGQGESEPSTSNFSESQHFHDEV